MNENRQCCDRKASAEQIFADALKVLPGGVSRNTIFRKPRPHYVDRAQGCYVTDIDGVTRIDFANNMCSLIHGHAHPEIVRAVVEQVHRGTAFTMGTEVEVRFAEHLCARIAGVDKIRFTNSGTEAVMAVIKAARAYTGRPMIAKAEGAYHGSYDYAEVSQTASPASWGCVDQPNAVPVARGTPQGALDDVVVFGFNDLARTLALLDRHAERIACVLIDPMPHRIGLFPADAGFVQGLFDWTRRNGALLAFDEVITFRSEYGGAQCWYPARPDLTALGKIIGGGFPCGAVGGRDEVMKVMDPAQESIPLPYSGTFSANPITMAAGKVAMELYDRVAVERLNTLGERARAQLREAIAVSGVTAQVSGCGSMFRVHPGLNEEPMSYRRVLPCKIRSAWVKRMLDLAYEDGVMLINTLTGVLSTPMTTAEVDRLSEVFLGVFRAIKPDIDRDFDQIRWGA